jgi:uncharacterized membrane protein
MNDYLKFLLLALIIDSIWISKPFHKQQYELIQKSYLEVDFNAAMLFYLFAPLAYIYFIKPLSKNKNDAMKYGALLGFLMYMTYDFTNKAVFKDYNWNYAIKDIIWGSFVFGLVSYLIY